MRSVLLWLIFAMSYLTANAADSAHVKSKVSVYAGGGYNAYFNSMTLFKDGIRNSNYGAMARIMWEPRYRISLGFESGLIRMYQWENTNTKDETISLYAVPLNSVISMKLYKQWYMNLAFGTALLLNNIKTKNETETATQFTVVNVYAESGYILPLSKKFSLVPALTYIFISKTEDRSLMIQTKIGYTF